MISPYRRIHGEGPTPCEFMAVGEAGGYWENEEGRPFVGKSGRLLNTYLEKVGIPRHRIFITNVFPYWTGEGNPDPTKEQINAGVKFLQRDLEAVRPRYLLALGRIASHYFMGSALSLEIHHGLPQLWRGSDRSKPVWWIPSYHPAAALRNPEHAGRCFWDIRQYSLLCKGQLPNSGAPIFPERVGDERVEYRRSKMVFIAGSSPAIDTEGSVERPWGLSYSTKEGEAQVVLAADIRPLKLPKVTFHHAMHDIPVLRAMRIEVEDDGYDDTILMARLLLLEPAGLKDLALRHCGMVMHSYDEVVAPHHQQAVTSFLQRATQVSWGKPEAQAVKDKKTGKWRTYQPHSIDNRLKAILRDIEKGGEINLQDRWQKISPPLRAPIEAKLGSFPVSHPSLAPLSEMIPYAARDADATRRIHKKLWPMIVSMGLEEAYSTDLHSIPMFERMASNGMLIDPDHFSRMRPVIATKLAEDSRAWCGKWKGGNYLNLASGDQVADYLFGTSAGQLGLKPVKMTKGGSRASVDEKTLELLKDQHPSIPGIVAWKKLHTNLTFVDRIPRHLHPNGRLYPNINTQGTITGRPSTSDPNLLNIPIRSELGKQIRKGFVAPDGRLLLSVDLCLAAGTLIDTPYGDKRIESMKVGDIVFGYAWWSRKPIASKVNEVIRIGRKKVLRVTLDNGKSVVCTPEHKWLICPTAYRRDPIERETQALTVGDRLLPLRRISVQGYSYLYSHQAIEYSKEHQAVALVSYGPKPNGYHVHHKNHHRYDNRPENLEYLPSGLHWSIHGKITARRCWDDEETRRKMSLGIKKSLVKRGGHHGSNNPRFGDRRRRNYSDCLFCSIKFESYASTGKKYCSRKCYFSARMEGLNHKVVLVEDAGYASVWSIGVDRCHNYALSAGVFTCNSQIELRIGAHLSGDKEMIRAFKAGEDLHQKTAEKLGLDRYTAKTINFGIFYGMSEHRLQSELLERGIDKSRDECASIIREWFHLYSGVRGWLETLYAGARRTGFVRGISGRIRYLPNLYLSKGHHLRAEAERHAGNFPVQEGAGYVVKRAMWTVWKWLRQNPEEGVEPLIQVYDELLFEVPEGKEDILPILKRMMTADSPNYRVPLKVDGAIGPNWGAL